MREHPRAPHLADLVADAVTDDGRDDDEKHHGGQVRAPEEGGDTPEHGRRLPRHDEADKDGVLDEDDDTDDQIDQPSRLVEDLAQEVVHGVQVCGIGAMGGRRCVGATVDP